MRGEICKWRENAVLTCMCSDWVICTLSSVSVLYYTPGFVAVPIAAPDDKHKSI